MDDDKSLKLRVPKERVVFDENLQVYWVDLGDSEKFLMQLMGAMTNPGMAVVRKDGND